MKNYQNITPEELNKKFATQTAKSWGFKSISDAKKNGYNTLRVSCTANEMADLLNISKAEATSIIDQWQYNGLVNRVCVADINCFYFKNTYK